MREGERVRSVNLVFAGSPAERFLLEGWLTQHGSLGEAAAAGDPQLASRLTDRADDPVVTPVGVSWLPPERAGVRRASVVDLLTFANPRRPSARLQERLLRRDPARSRVLAGAPARLSQLRARFEEVTGRSVVDDGFGAFVARQGRLALEREERALGGQRYKVPRLVAEDIRQSARFTAVVEGLARTRAEPVSEVAEAAAGALGEMVASQSRLAVDVWDQFTGWMSRAYALDVDEPGLERVRELGGEHALA